MVIKKKSREILKGQSERFLNYFNIIWKITDEKKDEIKWVLNDESVDISNIDELKNKLSLIVPGLEFHWLYLNYKKYNEVCASLKKLFSDWKIFPDWYDFLIVDLVNALFSYDGDSIDLSTYKSELIKDLLKDDTTLPKLKSDISDSINLLLSLNFPKESLGKLIWYVITNKEEYIDNLKLFLDAWVNDPVVLSNAVYIMEHYNSEKLKIFLDAWVKDPVDLLELKDNFSYFNVETLMNNLKLLLDAWVSNPKDFVKLKNLLCWNSDILKVFLDCWIIDADDLLNLSGWINSTSTDIKNIILSLKFIWISSADGFCKLWDLYLHGRYSLILPHLSEISNELWIKVDDKLYDLKMVFDEIVSAYNVYWKGLAELNVLFLYYRWYSWDDIKKIGEHLEYIKFSNLDFICNKFPNISIDNLCLLSDLLLGAKINNLKLIFDNFNISFDKLINIDFWIFKSRDEKNISLILEKFSDIDFDGLISLTSIVSGAIPSSLWLIFQHFSSITIEDLNFVDDNGISISEVLSTAQYSNLEKIFEKYPNIKVTELCSICNILGCTNVLSFKSFVDHFWSVDFDEFVKNLNFVDNDVVEEISISEVLSAAQYANLELIFEKYPNIKINELCSIWDLLDSAKTDNLRSFVDHFWFVDFDEFVKNLNFVDGEISILKILSDAQYNNLELIFEKYPEIKMTELCSIYNLLCCANTENLVSIFNYFWPINLNNLRIYQKLYLCSIGLPEFVQFGEDNHNWYLKYIEQVIGLRLSESDKISIISDICKLPLFDIDDYLSNLIKFCVNNSYSYHEFSKCFDWESINQDALKLLGDWFDVVAVKNTNIELMLYNSLTSLYPQLCWKFTREELRKIFDFVHNLWWINKWYSILILTMEKMFRDWINFRDFNSVLFNKLKNYKRIINMYPEDKIPEWLKISTWIEFEITRYFLSWYNDVTWNDYYDVVNKIVDKAKIW